MVQFTSCLPMVGDSLRVLWLLPPLKTGHHDIAETLLKVALNTKNQIKLSIKVMSSTRKLGYPVLALWFYCSQILLYYMAFQYFDIERT
jgi:hypothetical protein